MNNTLAWYEKAACHLSGVEGIEVKVRFCTPVVSYAGAQVYKVTGNFAIIDVFPFHGDVDKVFMNFLHEVAHLHNDFRSLPVTKLHVQPSGSFKASEAERAKARVSEMELRAERQAKEWYRFAGAHAHENYYAGEPGVVAWLRALCQWQESK